MATYFDPDAPTDVELLPEAMRRSAEIKKIHPLAERDVIRHFTRRASQFSSLGFPTLAETINQDLSLVVFLLGWKQDAADVDVDADLKLALKETIADVIAWRLRRRNHDPTIASEGTAVGKTVTWNEGSQSDLPPSFDWRLGPFDLREELWGF